MKPISTRNVLLNSFFLLFTFILCCHFTQSIINGYSKESWNISEFLINYHGGFIRRGLLGEIIIYLYNAIGIKPYTLILGICIFSYVTLICFFVRSFVKKGYPLFILPFIFFLGNPIINNFWLRKDILMILIFIMVIYLVTKRSRLNIILMNVVLITGLLIHESIAFFCFPILSLMLTSQTRVLYGTKRSWAKSFSLGLIKILPSLIVFFLTLYFHGSADASTEIWNSWKPVDFPIQANGYMPAAIEGITWTLSKALLIFSGLFYNFSGNIYAPIAWALILSAIYHVLTNTSKLNFKILNYKSNKNFNKKIVSTILVVQFLAVIPLFILGWDYARWVFYWTTSSFAIILIIPEKELAGVFPEIISAISTRINNNIESLVGNSNILFLCLLIGFPVCSWDLGAYVGSNSFVMTLQFISTTIKQIIDFISANL